VVCSTTNERQARAITEGLRAEMQAQGLREMGLEGVNDARWILQDFGDVVAHVFHESQRPFYDIEGLWADARRVRWQTAGSKA
jgi:ribosome-associated protein